MQSCIFDYPKEIEMRSYKPIDKGHTGQIRKAVQMMLQAERPLVYAGGGVILSDSAPELNKLVDRLGMPCVNTLQGLGGYRASSEKYIGMPGMHGKYEANLAMQHCDVLIAVGARFDDRVIGNPEHFSKVDRKIIHIDIDPSSISKRVKVDIPIVGNVKDVLQEMLAQLDAAPAGSINPQALAPWWAQINEWRKKDCLKYAYSDQIIKPQFVIEKLWEVTKGDAYIASDVGQHQMWAAQYYPFDKPRRWLNSGGLGTMGVGLPYAMGIQMANPGATVACITGEGSIQMNIQELATCKQYNLTPKIIMLNNGVLGMVRQWQNLFYEQRYSSTTLYDKVDFVKVAEAMGAKAKRVETIEEFETAFKEAVDSNEPYVLDCIIDSDDKVWPMVAPGGSISDAFNEEDLEKKKSELK